MKHLTLASVALAALGAFVTFAAPDVAYAERPARAAARRLFARRAPPRAAARPRAVVPPAQTSAARDRAEALGALGPFDAARPVSDPFAAMATAPAPAAREEVAAPAGAGAGASDAPVPTPLSVRGHDGATPTRYGVWLTWEVVDRPTRAPAPRPAR